MVWLPLSLLLAWLMGAEVAQGKNPYADLITLSKGNNWKVQMGISGNDAVTAKTTVESSNGDNGVPWIGGQAGGSGQPVLEFTGDIVEAGYNINDTDTRIITDEHASYKCIGEPFEGGHEVVCHSAKEYVRGEIHSNTAEGFFSSVKRDLNGIYHSVSKEHLHRYMAEFEFRYNHRNLEDGERTLAAIKASEVKRLMYREPVAQ